MSNSHVIDRIYFLVINEEQDIKHMNIVIDRSMLYSTLWFVCQMNEEESPADIKSTALQHAKVVWAWLIIILR